ncbi:hypothetical protein N7533_007101 [Penicillium manginii]|jgi:protein BUR2|uniref:uncharacterized protein n=1 Tax=Penicillium manginii TaxID=203109 RepID=UPI002547AE93|nr:uncharacterized protein N7533_007101 [Penicillium manginii]KAJ5750073.1 hypothetical protein N7533_007101 [Penicillium manginii]
MDQSATSRGIPGLPNPVVAAAQEKWMFTDEELERTPTRLDKIEREKEDYIRHRAVEFIWQVSMMLRMPPQTSMTASVLMHRFLMRYSLRGQYPEQAGDLMHPKVIAAVALFVAFKVDETMRRMKDFVVACCRVAMKKPDMVVDEQSKDYWKWRDLILQNESVMLEFLCFDLQMESPYKVLWEYSLFLGVQENRPLRHAAYAFLNDSTYTILCLQFPARVIAAAALYAAARHTQVAFPDDSQGRPWWEQIDVRIEDLIKSCKLIVKIYERVQQTLSKGYPDFTFSDTDPTDPTRLFNSNPTSFELTPKNSLATSAGESSTPNGRKRSREPESHSQDQKQPTPAPASLNGWRSPKRQRTISPMPGTTPANNSQTQAPSSRPRIPMRAMETLSTPKVETTSPTPATEPETSVPNPKGDPSAKEGEIKEHKSAAPEPSDSQIPPPTRDEGGGSEEGEV